MPFHLVDNIMPPLRPFLLLRPPAGPGVSSCTAYFRLPPSSISTTPISTSSCNYSSLSSSTSSKNGDKRPELASTTQIMHLPDGRKLAYAEYGALDHPNSTPVFYFHGFPSSRLEMHGLEHIVARNSIRLIAPDRPGFGASTPYQGRRIADYPSDILALAAHLGLSRFRVLGGSGGGPYALACGALLPGHTLDGVGVMAGAPPWEAGPGEALPEDLRVKKHMEGYRRVMARMAEQTPGLLRVLSDLLVGSARWASNTKPGMRRIDAWLESQSRKQEGKEDKEERLSIEEQRRRLLSALFEPFRQGSGAMVQEALLLSRDWGFRFEDVQTPVKIWHGTKDTNAPLALMRYMARRLPDAELVEYEGNHYDAAGLFEAILSNLVSESTR